MSRLRSAARVTGQITGGLVALVLVLYLALLAINWRDQPPNEAYTELHRLAMSEPSIPDRENGFVFTIGLTAEPAWPPERAGKALLEPVRKNWRERDHDNDAWSNPYRFVPFLQREVTEFARERRTDVEALFEACGFGGEVDPEESDTDQCLTRLMNEDQAFQAWREEWRWLLDRYAELMAYEHWQPVHASSSPIPDFYETVPLKVLGFGQQLYLAEAIRKGLNGEAGLIRQRFARDARYWRRVMKNAPDLLWRRVAEERLKQNLQYLNLSLLRVDRETASGLIPPIWREPIGPAERSLRSALAGELHVGQVLLEHHLRTRQPWWGKLLIKPFYQQQGTDNLRARWMQERIAKSGLSWPKLGDWLAEERGVDLEAEHAPHFFGPLYNPAGRYYVRHGGGSWRSYFATTAELEVARVAFLAAAEFGGTGASASALEQYLERNAPRNPLTGQPLKRDSDSASIRVSIPGGLEDGGKPGDLRFPVRESR